MNPVGLDLLPVDRTWEANLHRRADEDQDPTRLGRWSESLRERGPSHAAVVAYVAAREGERRQRAPVYRAAEVMTADVVTVRVEAGVEEAWRTLAARRIQQAPVLDPAHRIVGLVSREHLLAVLNEVDGRISDVVSCVVGEVMATPIVVASPTTDVRHIARIMLDQRLPAVPIVNPTGRILGIVSARDILGLVAADPSLDLWA